MPRSGRVAYEGGSFHVLIRGNNKGRGISWHADSTSKEAQLTKKLRAKLSMGP